MKKLILIFLLISGTVFAKDMTIQEKCELSLPFKSTKEECDQCSDRYFKNNYCRKKLDSNSTQKESQKQPAEARGCHYKRCFPPGVRKPIIYLYPTEKTEVSVVVGKPHNLTHTYPKYQNGWHVVAETNGNLTDKNGRHYYALYWEGKRPHKPTPKDGFIVKGSETISFLEEKLASLGLSEREANEFIVYWLPKLEVNEYNFIRFETKDEIEENMPLYITPKPDTIIRVLMEYRKADETEKPVIQELPSTPERKGFVVVEWGGTEI